MVYTLVMYPNSYYRYVNYKLLREFFLVSKPSISSLFARKYPKNARLAGPVAEDAAAMLLVFLLETFRIFFEDGEKKEIRSEVTKMISVSTTALKREVASDRSTAFHQPNSRTDRSRADVPDQLSAQTSFVSGTGEYRL